MDNMALNTTVPKLGEPKIPSAIQRGRYGERSRRFVSETERVLVSVDAAQLQDTFTQGETPLSFELAGPRSTVYFDASKLRCAMVTCGGLCPGINDIIRAIVLELYYGYGVRNIYGIRYGLQGFIPAFGHDIMELHPDRVVNILEMGGTILGSSRGPQPIDEIV